jgi:phosphoribosylformylglycinamidine synthase
MIKNTHKQTPEFTISAYSDNAAVLSGEIANYWAPEYSTGSWKLLKEVVQPIIKVETHNHPTAISPFAGAATGSGGELRDEGAVGRGSTPKAGLVGFFVSDLCIPSKKGMRAWESEIGKPAHYASSLDIMLEGPIGSARFNNEFGRPVLTGTFKLVLRVFIAHVQRTSCSLNLLQARSLGLLINHPRLLPKIASQSNC